MEQIDKDIVLAAIIRTFFKYFVTGIIEIQSDVKDTERYEPKNVKRIMLDYYESVAPVFNEEAFYSIFRMNYNESEIEKTFANLLNGGASMMQLVRVACRDESFYDAMVAEYKRNFEMLLCGNVGTNADFMNSYTQIPETGKMSVSMAENIIDGIAAKAYERGMKLAKQHEP